MTRDTDNDGLREAILWEASGEQHVRCRLCAHHCDIGPGKLGICQVRINLRGTLYTRVYGRAVSLGLDPIEKKPLFHFHPGARTLSLATVGCNFSCMHCQNCSISHWPRGRSAHEPVPGDELGPDDVVRIARQRRATVIAYTYSEPTIYLEYALDIARLARKQGMRNVFVTNGYMTREALELVAPVLDAANVDLKGLDDAMLRREVKAESGPVLETIAELHARGVWVEVTTLVIPGSNDDDEQLHGIAEFIAGIDPGIPWHVSRFHPTYKRLDRPSTPPETLRRARRLGQAAGLHHVYTGNLWGDDGESTRCAGCGALLIERTGYTLGALQLRQGACTRCGARLAGRGLP